MNTELQAVIDSIEADVQRVRNMDPALKTSIVAKLDQARALDAQRRRPNPADGAPRPANHHPFA